jgi:hypothetical protein
MRAWIWLGQRIVAVVAAIFGFFLSIWTGARAMLDWVGRGDTLSGLAGNSSLLSRALGWLFATPWWVPGLLATLMTLALIYLLLRPSRDPAPAGAHQKSGTAWLLRHFRSREPQPQQQQSPPPKLATDRDFGRAIPLIDIQLDFSQFEHVTPVAAWLGIICTGFNGSAYPVRFWSARGRIQAAGQEFHGQLELVDRMLAIGADTLYRLRLRIALSPREAEFLLKMRDREVGKVSYRDVVRAVRTNLTCAPFPRSEPCTLRHGQNA